jgi:hypothetical protein
MYSAVLFLHSWVRWLVLIAGIVAFVGAVTHRGRPWSSGNDRATLLYTIALDVQLLLGLLLYLFLSPVVSLAFQNMGAAMQTTSVRFFVVEHAIGMVLAVVAAHIGRVRVRKAAPDAKRRAAATFIGISLLLILLAMPWPALPYARPLFRL